MKNKNTKWIEVSKIDFDKVTKDLDLKYHKDWGWYSLDPDTGKLNIAVAREPTDVLSTGYLVNADFLESVKFKFGNETKESCDGMTLRDYFAAKAMVAIMTNEDELNRIRCSYQENKQRIAIAHHAYAIADAMIEARKHE